MITVAYYNDAVLHFAFRDAAIGYDCVACGARCCHGLGFALAGAELVPLVGRAPGIAPFLQLARDAVHAFDLEDGCWQLGSDGRCGIEVAHGRAAKPSTCRLFPANRLWRAGGVVIVDLQLAHCPLVDARKGPRTVIRWDDVARDLAEAGDGALAAEAGLPPATPDDWLAREAAVRDAGDDAPLPRAEAQAAWRAFFGVADDEAAALAAEVAPLQRLALPSLRLQLLTMPGAPPYPKLMRAIDAQLAAGAWLAALSVRAGRAPSLRALAELWRGLPLVRELLVRWHARVTLADEPAPASAPPEVAATWTALQARAAVAPIGEALATTTLPAALRPLLLRLASDRMR
jgi:hypothetical protein